MFFYNMQVSIPTHICNILHMHSEIFKHTDMTCDLCTYIYTHIHEHVHRNRQGLPVIILSSQRIWILCVAVLMSEHENEDTAERGPGVKGS